MREITICFLTTILESVQCSVTRRVMMASAASLLNLALSRTLTARCYTTMVTALLAGSPLPLIRTCPPGWGPTPAVFAVIETPWTTGRSRAFPLSWSRCDLPASVFVEYVEGSTAEKSQNLSEKYERRVVTPSLSLPSRGRQYAEHDQPSLLELIRAATAEQTFCSIMMVQKFSLRIRELQARL